MTRPYPVTTRSTLNKIVLCAVLLGLSGLTALSHADSPAAKKKTANPAPKSAPKPDTKPAGGKEVQESAKAKEDADTSTPDDDKDPNDTTYNLVERDPTGDHYTSVIIDASDFHIASCMSPKICKADDTKVWPNLSYIDPDYVISYGIVIYAHSLEEARSLKRAGKNPLVIRASGRGKTDFDPVITDEDAETILTANKRNKCMDKFKVIFILDKKASSTSTAQSASAPKQDVAKNTEKPADKKD